MASTIQDEIYQSFLEVSRRQAAEMTQTTQSLADLILQADNVRSDFAQETARKAGASSASATSGSSGSGNPGTGSGGSSVLSTVYDVFKSGLGVSPLIQGIMGLFGGGDAPAPAPLVKYALPPAVHFQAAEANGRIANIDYDQNGLPRAYAAPTVPAAPMGGDEVSGGPVARGPQITVNVQAMDARSFMDRSNEIALAVRDAMLNSNAINDVVGEL
jgi:hypothetical protein